MIVERAASVAQYAFLAYLGLLSVVLYGLFVPSQCSASMTRSTACPRCWREARRSTCGCTPRPRGTSTPSSRW